MERQRGKNKLNFYYCVYIGKLGHLMIDINTYTGGSFPDFLDPALEVLDAFVFTLVYDRQRPKGAFCRPFPPALVGLRSIFPDYRKLTMPFT